MAKKFDKRFNKEKSVVLGMAQGLTVDQALDAIEFEERMERRIAEDAIRPIAIATHVPVHYLLPPL